MHQTKVNPYTRVCFNFDSTAEAFNAGVADGYQTGNRALRDYDNARDAYLNWSRARFEHAETSYYGRFHIETMRAYWLGVRRIAVARIRVNAP